MSEGKTIEFIMREYYASDEHTMKVRNIPIVAKTGTNKGGYEIIDMTRTDTGAEMYQYETEGWAFEGKRDYVAVCGHGGWGKSDILSTALDNMRTQSALTKAAMKKLATLRVVRVWECAPGSGWVDNSGGAHGVCLRDVQARYWLNILWDMVKPKLSK